MSQTVADDPTARTGQGSELCIACGLCCQGMLHSHAVLNPDETELATALKLPLYTAQEEAETYLAFRLPCPCLTDEGCSVYHQRPSPCQGYRCRLLKRFLGGEASFALSLDLIQTANKLLDDIRQQIGPGDPTLNLWQQIRIFANQHPISDELRTDIKTLWTFCHYQFDASISGMKFPLDKW